MIILDTNVLSEIIKPAPSPEVIRWLADRTAAELYTTSITAAEISQGICLMAEGARREKLEAAMANVFEQVLRGRVLVFDHQAGYHFGRLVSARQRRGAPIQFADAAIASIALAHKAPVATRDIVDFDGLGVELINPWACGK